MNDQITIRTGEQIDVDIGETGEPINLDIDDTSGIDLGIDEKIRVSDYEKLMNLPRLNGHVIFGDKTAADYDIKEDSHFVYTQSIPSDIWIVQHNLGKKPAITVSDSAGTIVVGQYTYLDDNTVKLEFVGAFSGKAYFN